MDLDIQYLMRQALIQTPYLQDITKMVVKFWLSKIKKSQKINTSEAAPLQGFPENYIIPVSDTQAYKQFGNSVSVPVVHAIASNIFQVLQQNKNN